MKEYLLNNNEERYLKGIINKTVKRYFTIKYKRESIATFEPIDLLEEKEVGFDILQVQEQFFKEELLKFAKPNLTKGEYKIFKQALNNHNNIKNFKRYLSENKNYDYKLLARALKKIGGLLNGWFKI